jgi:glycosyltransferase involved in cell wall biosynthesis
MGGSERPLVSVCIPAYNARRWIAECLESVLAQTCPADEVIVADDASTDATREIAGAYRPQGVRLICAEHNLGRYANQNLAMRACQGAFVVKLDADDRLSPTYLETLVPVMLRHPGLGFATCDFNLIDEAGRPFAQDRRIWPLGRRPGQAEFMRYVVEGPKARGTCVLFRRTALESVGGCDERFIYGGDWWLFLKLLAVSDVYYSGAILADYRAHAVGKAERALWQALDMRLMLRLLPELWPPGMEGFEECLQVARRRYALWAVVSTARAPAALHPQILGLAREMDPTWRGQANAWLARQGFAALLAFGQELRARAARQVKRPLAWLRERGRR